MALYSKWHIPIARHGEALCCIREWCYITALSLVIAAPRMETRGPGVSFIGSEQAGFGKRPSLHKGF